MGCNDIVQLAAGSTDGSSSGKGTILLNEIDLKGSVHIDGLTDTLLSIAHRCNDDKTVFFMKTEYFVLNLNMFSDSHEAVVTIIKGNPETHLYEINEFKNHLALKATVSNHINPWHRRFAHTNVKILIILHKKSSNVPRLKECLHAGHP